MPQFEAMLGSLLGGIALDVSPYICEWEFVRWKRNHRRSRINKKWHKRYGAVTECKGQCWRVGQTILACPHFKKELNKETKP